MPVVLGASVLCPGGEPARSPEGAPDALRPVEPVACTYDGLNALSNQIGNRPPALRGEVAQRCQLMFRHLGCLTALGKAGRKGVATPGLTLIPGVFCRICAVCPGFCQRGRGARWWWPKRG